MSLKQVYPLFVLFILSGVSLHADEKSEKNHFSLTGPKGWCCISDKTQLPSKVDIVYIGDGKEGGFTPSINVASEPTKVPLNEYILSAKNYHETTAGTLCSHLGTIETKAGRAELLQIDRKTGWGTVRFIQAALIHEGTAYVLTATCLQEEFSSLYSQFFQTIQSFAFSNENTTEVKPLTHVTHASGKKGSP